MVNRHNNRTDIKSQYKAFSKRELLSFLERQNLGIPSRTTSGDRSRRRDTVERMLMFRTFAALAQQDFFSYPLEWFHQDRPDLLLHYDDHEVGIECVEAVSQEWAEIDALMEREGKSFVLSEDNFRIGMPKRTASERRRIIEKQPYGTGWGDNGMEREWALGIDRCVRDKTRAFKEPGFQKYDKNWLLIWSNLPGIVRDIKTGMEYLVPKLTTFWSIGNSFDKLSIDVHQDLVEVQSDKWIIYPIPSLWN